jgi:hypothetical protein
VRTFVPVELAPYSGILAYLRRIGGRKAYRRAMEKGTRASRRCWPDRAPFKAESGARMRPLSRGRWFPMRCDVKPVRDPRWWTQPNRTIDSWASLCAARRPWGRRVAFQARCAAGPHRGNTGSSLTATARRTGQVVQTLLLWRGRTKGRSTLSRSLPEAHSRPRNCRCQAARGPSQPARPDSGANLGGAGLGR